MPCIIYTALSHLNFLRASLHLVDAHFFHGVINIQKLFQLVLVFFRFHPPIIRKLAWIIENHGLMLRVADLGVLMAQAISLAKIMLPLTDPDRLATQDLLCVLGGTRTYAHLVVVRSIYQTAAYATARRIVLQSPPLHH